jgi:hypothetical protein
MRHMTCPNPRATRRPVSALATVALLLSGAFACGTGSHGTDRPSAAADVPQPARAVRSGHLRITPLAGKCGIFVLSGTHALLDATGEFCRLRVRVESADSSSHAFSPYDQMLVLANGRRVAPSHGGMLVRRQPETVTLGADDLAEVVLIWDVPEGAPVTGVRLIGDNDSDAAGAFVTPAVNVRGVVVPLKGFSTRPKADS